YCTKHPRPAAQRLSLHDALPILIPTLTDALHQASVTLQDGDVLAISSKYVAISENRIVTIDDVMPSDRAHELAEKYRMDARIAQDRKSTRLNSSHVKSSYAVCCL